MEDQDNQVLELIQAENRKMNEKFFYDGSFIDYLDMKLEHFFYDLSFDDYTTLHSNIQNQKTTDLEIHE